MKVVFSKYQLQYAAEYIFQHNVSMCKGHDLTSVDKVKDNILQHIIEGAKAKHKWCSTGGWMLHFERNDSYVRVYIYVDPSVGLYNSEFEEVEV